MKKILVTGTNRSGTTWVGKILSANRDVAYIHEPFNIDHCSERLGLSLRHWCTYIPDLESPEEFYRDYNRIFAFKAFPSYPDSDAWHLTLRNKLVDRIKGVVRRHRASTILIKDPIALLSSEQLSRHYNMKVVCMIRHPLAFCSSIKKWNWAFPFTHFLEQRTLMKEHFSDYEARISEFSGEQKDIMEQSILLWNLYHCVIKYLQENNPEWIFLRHEDVVQSPIKIFEDTYEKLGIRFSDAARTAIKASLNSKEGETQDTSFKERDAKQVLQTWKKRLSEEEIEAVIHGTSGLREHFYPDA